MIERSSSAIWHLFSKTVWLWLYNYKKLQFKTVAAGYSRGYILGKKITEGTKIFGGLKFTINLPNILETPTFFRREGMPQWQLV